MVAMLDNDLVHDLLRPEALGARDDVALRTTHTSWVFLTEGNVWKVKRPVDLGFLDLRTIEARRQACEEEVRLNRRLAPEVYLGVTPIRMTADGYSLFGEGPVVDWAVHMVRLPDAASASSLLARGCLDARALERVVEALAAFWRSARPTPAFGAPDTIGRELDDDFAMVAPFVGDLVDRRTFEEVEAAQRAELARKRPRFIERMARDHVREGHGDLRLDHVYLLGSDIGSARPVIIDCNELDAGTRCNDAAAEIAFLAMELQSAGRPDLAAGFIARFAEATDDFGLYGVLDFHLSRRAWMRGKVAALVAANAAATPYVRKVKRDEARRHLALARSFSGAPLDRPFLIVVGGVAGSGKSTLAAELGRALAVPVVSSDRTYPEIITRARHVLEAGRGVILDATFASRRWRHAAAAAAAAAGASFAFVETSCPRARLRQRLAARRAPASTSDATDELLDAFLQEYEPVTSGDPGPRFTVDTSGTDRNAAHDALRLLACSGIFEAADRRAS